MGNLKTGTYYWLFRWFLAVLFLVAWAGVASAQSSPTIIRVEEDWEMVVGQPDSTTGSPQVLCVISPVDHVAALHGSLELNHHNTFESVDGTPTFEPGGMQFEVWDGETPMRERKFPVQAVLSTPGEVITWTQSMELSNNKLTFDITNGTSSTWGSFGAEGYLKPYPVSTNLTDLNGYSPDVSVQNSEVIYAANRVQSLVLKRVRVYTSTGEIIEDSTPRVVHSLD
jgi:hypothetical protein